MKITGTRKITSIDFKSGNLVISKESCQEAEFIQDMCGNHNTATLLALMGITSRPVVSEPYSPARSVLNNFLITLIKSVNKIGIRVK